MVVLLLSIATLSLVATVVGIRILLVARRTHGTPELALGVMLLSLGAFSIPLNSAGRALASVEVSQLFSVASSLASAVGIAALFVFTALVFHRGQRWAQAIVGLVVLSLAYYVVGHAIDALAVVDEAGATAVQLRWTAFTVVPSIFGFAWSGVSAFGYYRSMRKQLALGLADPVVVNRMLLWSLIGIVCVATAGSAGILLAVGGPALREFVQPLLTALGGVVASVLLWLAFAPPHRFVEYLRSNTAGATV